MASVEGSGNRKGSSNYVRGAAEFARLIESNIRDYKFSYASHGEIRYVFDTNVVRFFLNPVPESEQIDTGLGKVFSGMSLKPGVLASLAVVTAEFLFSRNLCGQWGSPALISPSHARELERYADELLRKIDRERREEEHSTSLRRLINDAIIKARVSKTISSSIDTLFSNEDEIRHLISGSTYEARMFKRLGGEDLLEPLYSDVRATKDVLCPEGTAREQWASKIAKSRKESVPNKNAAKQPRSVKRNKTTGITPQGIVEDRDNADAETLMQVLLLNRRALAESAPARYVLVTLDNAILNAAEEEHAYFEREVGFVPVRHLSQYNPVINVVEMPNNITGTTITDHIKEAVDTFFTGLLGGGHTNNRIAIDAGGAGGAITSALSEDLSALERMWGEFDEAAKRNLKEQWEDLAEQAVYLNASLLSRRIRAFSGLAELLESQAGTREAVLRYMEDTVDAMERSHVEFSIRNNLATAVASVSWENETATRGLLMLRSRFKSLTGNVSLYEFLNQVVLEKNDRDRDVLYKSLAESGHYKTFLLAGCVAFWAGAWSTAEYFADRAVARFEQSRHQGEKWDPTDEAELLYFQAVACRYMAMDQQKNMKARENALDRAADHILNARRQAAAFYDRFATIRINIEESLCEVTRAYVVAIDDESRIDEARAHVKQSFSCLMRCKEKLETLQDNNEDKHLLRQTQIEVYVALAGCIIFEFFYVNDMSAQMGEEVEQLRKVVESVTSQDDTMIPSVYRLALTLLDLMGESDTARQEKASSELYKEFEAMGSAETGTTRLDRIVIADLQEKIATRANSSTRAG